MQQGQSVLAYYDCLCRYYPLEVANQNINCQTYTQVYWYHPDYLAPNELITDRSGNPYQYFHYTAWGESFAQAIYCLNANDLEIDLLINFGSKRLGFK